MSGGAKAAIAVVVVVVVIIGAVVVFNFLRTSTSSPVAQANVQVTNLGASASCPLFQSPYVTFTFTLVNSGNANAYADVAFYAQGSQVGSNRYYAAAGSSTPYSANAVLSSCPPSGFSFDISITSVTSA